MSAPTSARVATAWDQVGTLPATFLTPSVDCDSRRPLVASFLWLYSTPGWRAVVLGSWSSRPPLNCSSPDLCGLKQHSSAWSPPALQIARLLWWYCRAVPLRALLCPWAEPLCSASDQGWRPTLTGEMSVFSAGNGKMAVHLLFSCLVSKWNGGLGDWTACVCSVLCLRYIFCPRNVGWSPGPLGCACLKYSFCNTRLASGLEGPCSLPLALKCTTPDHEMGGGLLSGESSCSEVPIIWRWEWINESAVAHQHVVGLLE